VSAPPPDRAAIRAAAQALCASLNIDPGLVADDALTPDGGIVVVPDGPYLAVNVADLRDWLGSAVPADAVTALCRCGASERKPFCDGSHARIGFRDTKSPDRVPDHRDTYVGQQVTIHDNRGICQHSGLCTDRLSTVFRVAGDPFVAPSGGRMDEIVRAVRDCPSGALSYSVDEVEERETVDHHRSRPPGIEITRDGPYRVTGGLPLCTGSGANVERAEGSSLEHYALCRCGQSRNKPFCSGMHYYAEFHDPVPDPQAPPTMFEWAGGISALTRMTRIFYEKYVPQDPLLAGLFATMSADHPQRVAAWLGEVFGGPAAYSTGYGGYPRMLSQHRDKGITEEMRARWVELLLRSAHEAGLPNDAEFRSAFQSYIEWGSRLAVENSQLESRPPEHMPMPHWGWNTAAGPPGSRVSALGAQTAAEPSPTVTVPPPGEPVEFDAHIKPLFRAHDRNSMLFAFDLWSVDDVTTHANAILSRLRAGTMPCDGAWPKEWTDLFERWAEDIRR
jgi:CDGSH-type Zn-finger protein/truncated hemoglobin YjbI